MLCVLYHCFSLMQACCDTAFKYAHEREQFGQKIGTFQVTTILYFMIHQWLTLKLKVKVRFAEIVTLYEKYLACEF